MANQYSWTHKKKPPKKIGKNLDTQKHVGPKIDFKSLRKLKPALALKIAQSLELYRIVINSDEFKDAVLNHTYNGRKRFKENRGWSNRKIYEDLMSRDHNLYVTYYWEDTNTIGWGSTKDDITRMNLKYYDKMTPQEIASNLLHEEAHDWGWKHDMARTKDREKTVPYALGYIMKRLAKKVLQETTAA